MKISRKLVGNLEALLKFSLSLNRFIVFISMPKVALPKVNYSNKREHNEWRFENIKNVDFPLRPALMCVLI